MESIRQPAVAGSFYPANPEELKAMLDGYLGEADNRGPSPKALIAPHAGYIYSGPVAATCYSRLIPVANRIHRVILMGHSEGGNTTDNWSKRGFAAHIIVGSACTLVNGFPAAPEGVPVLALVGEKDETRPGLSCTVRRTIGGSKSIVIPGAGHVISRHPETKAAIRNFLRACCSKTASRKPSSR